MKKFFSFITVFAIALFVLPFSNTALADGEDTSTIAPDEAYEIDYIVKHETDDAASAADGCFQKPAHLFDKDGEKYVQLTVTSWSMIDFLKTNNGDVVVVKENSDDSALVQRSEERRVGKECSYSKVTDYNTIQEKLEMTN